MFCTQRTISKKGSANCNFHAHSVMFLSSIYFTVRIAILNSEEALCNVHTSSQISCCSSLPMLLEKFKFDLIIAPTQKAFRKNLGKKQLQKDTQKVC